MKNVALYDVDSRIPNLALMKLSAWHKARGWNVRMRMLRRFAFIPFFQEYWPLPDLPACQPDDFFDMDLREVIRLTFRSNGYNWEKYLRWLNRLYFGTFGQYYRPLVETIYRYNNKERIERYLRRPELLTTELYR